MVVMLLIKMDMEVVEYSISGLVKARKKLRVMDQVALEHPVIPEQVRIIIMEMTKYLI